MKYLSEDTVQALVANGKVLERVGSIPKVIALENNKYYKAFFHKSLSSKILSKAKKFSKNARKLQKKAIDTVVIDQTFRMKNPVRDCLIYEGLPGIILRGLLIETPRDKNLSKQLGTYLAELHNKGVMFRSVHLRNIIVQADKNFGLIDISDMRINFFPLNGSQRKRNLKHLFRYASDKNSLDLDAFIDGYTQSNQNRKIPNDVFASAVYKTSPKFQS